jgi:hypothetical protein
MSKPRLVFLADYPNWAFDYVAQSIARRLSDRFRFRIEYASRHPWVTAKETDLLYVFFWGYKVPKEAGFSKQQVIKEVASWGWELTHRHEKISKEEFSHRYLDDCGWVTTPCAAIYSELTDVFPRVVHCPNGVEYDYFSEGAGRRAPNGGLKIGWVGNPQDEHKVKGLHEILLPAAEGFSFTYSDGRMGRRQLRDFYANIDVLAIGSLSESQPLPLLESMSAGCFPVSTCVGIVPELVVDGKNGLIVERSVQGFAEAFRWCSENVDQLRSRRLAQSEFAAGQSWDLWAPRFGDLFDAALEAVDAEHFRPPVGLTGVVVRKRSDTLRRKGPVPRRLTHLVFDIRDGLRRWFLGDRFGKGPGESIYAWYYPKRRWCVAVVTSFRQQVRDKGIWAAGSCARQSATLRMKKMVKL